MVRLKSWILNSRLLEMKSVAQLALDTAAARGATYADARVVATRSRALTTKNGRVGHASESDSLGMGVRVIANGAWGFAAIGGFGPRCSRSERRRAQSRLRKPRHA